MRMLALLPTDGTPVLNRVMRVMLCRDMRRTVEQDEFFAARDLLLKQGRIGRLRGQGGQLFLIAETPAETAEPERPSAPGKPWPEAALMAPLGRYLESQFRQGLDLAEDAACVVQDTSAMGPLRGRWARPDFVLVSAMRFKLMPGAQIDVHSFELKTEDGATDLAVYEALAQTRFTHFGHLVWHLPKDSRAENRLAEIEKQCDEHGVGLIRMYDPDHVEGCDILIDPVRKPTAAIIVDGFLETRLNPAQRAEIARATGGAGR